MRSSFTHLALFFALCISVPILTTSVAGQAPAQTPVPADTGGLKGTAVDSSGAVLPGVVVSAISADGRPVGSTVTDGNGAFRFDGLPIGPATLRFQLDGFVDAQATVTVRAGGSGSEAPIVRRLELAAIAEQVTVRAEPSPPPPPPPPTLVPVPPHDESSVCAPVKADAPVPSIGTLKADLYEPTKNLFAAGQELVIDGGTLTGLSVGQNFVVRRRFATGLTSGARRARIPVVGEHASGLVQIVSVDERMSTAVVVYTCGGMMTGDYLATFEPEPIRPPDPAGRPAFDLAARILFADVGQLVGVARRMLVIDRGTAHGFRPGQRVTLFRKSITGHPAILGQAVVVSVKGDSATIQVESSRDVVLFGLDGDWAAPQRPVQVGQR